MSDQRSRGRKRKPGQRRGQSRVLGRTRKERMIELYAGLDDPARYEAAFQPGLSPAPGPDWDPDGEPDGEADHDQGPDDGEEAGLGLAPLLGARPPVVLLRLEAALDGVRARRLVAPRPEVPGEADVLAELAAFVEGRFRHGRETLPADAWDRLVGTKPAAPLRRAALLASLAAPASAPLADGQPGTPNDRGIEQFRGKFAALPDGMPFSLRLLIQDGRGKKKGTAEDDGGPVRFSGLPWFVRLQALARALRDEEREVRRAGAVDPAVLTDEEFTRRLHDAVTVLLGGDLPVRRPAVSDLTELRRTLKQLGEKLQSDGLAGLFPNSKDRAAGYRAQPAQPPAGRPAGEA